MDETRALFFKRQEEHAGMSTRMWKWDMMFNMLMGGAGRDREGGIAGYIVRLLRVARVVFFFSYRSCSADASHHAAHVEVDGRDNICTD